MAGATTTTLQICFPAVQGLRKPNLNLKLLIKPYLQRFKMFALLFFLVVVACTPFERRQDAPQHSRCRFAFDFTQDQLRENSTEFEENMLYWDGQFHQDGVGYDQSTGTTIDHVLLGYATGLPGGPPEMISNPRNEAYQIMLLAHAIAGNKYASIFVNPANPANATGLAVAILNTKLSTYTAFNNTYPGYGGFLPRFQIDAMSIRPVDASRYTVSALDNGYLVWALCSLIQVLRDSQVTEFMNLAVRWTTYFLYLQHNVKGIFLNGPQLGSICAVSTLLPGTLPYASVQKYACEDDADTLNDPYSGELMTWFMYYSGLNGTEARAIMVLKRPQLQATNFTGSIVDTSHIRGGLINYTGESISGRHILPITIQKGLYFGAQEHLKLLFLPYLDVPIVERVMRNAERVRTCNSVLMGSTPGLFAAVTNSTSPAQQGTTEYVYTAGIPGSPSFNATQEQDLITPYAAFATILFDRGVGLSWYHNVLSAKCMQSVYGSVNSIRRDGSAVSRVVSWETKAPVLLALLGGIRGFIRDAFRNSDILSDFYEIVAYEHSMVFDETWNGGTPLMGEDVPFCLPNAMVSGLGLNDYSTCNAMK